MPVVHGDRFWNKNWFSALEVSDTHNTDDQSGSVSIARATYGSGDTFGVQTSLTYAGDIMSAGGDEGGIVYSAEVRHDVDLFSGVVESWNPDTQTLIYSAQNAANTWKIGTSRPIVNMNPQKWIQSGRIVVPQNGFDYNGIASAVVGTAAVQWDASIVGKFIASDEPSEYYEAKELAAFGVDTGTPIVRRWFRIATLAKRADGLWNLGIETVWWGNYQGGKPPLLHYSNYTTANASPKELRYIIAPGSWAIDVRNALGPRKYYVGATPQERSIRLAPRQPLSTARHRQLLRRQQSRPDYPRQRPGGRRWASRADAGAGAAAERWIADVRRRRAGVRVHELRHRDQRPGRLRSGSAQPAGRQQEGDPVARQQRRDDRVRQSCEW